MKTKVVSEQEKSQALESALYKLSTGLNEKTGSTDHEVSFYGHILQSLSINYSTEIPTAGVYFDNKLKTFKLLINPNYFTSLNLDQRMGLLLHELFHITFRHVYYDYLSYDKKMLNISMDLVINQYIKVLPDGCMDYKKFFTKDKQPFPKLSTTEHYYSLLKDDAKMELDKNSMKKMSGMSDKEFQDMIDNLPAEMEAETDNNGNISVKAKEWFKDKEFDQHGWEDGDDGSALEKMEALKDLIKRTMQKTSYSYGHAPKMVQDLLETLDKNIEKLNYKKILLDTLKKSLPSKDTEKTWVRPSRRYGDLAKGTKLGKMPKIDFYIDTSGSISIEEANELLSITNEFMTVGVEKAYVHLWADDIYFTKQIKRNFQIQQDDFKSGGTDLNGVMQSIAKRKPELAIILTDGYFGEPKIDKKKLLNTKIVFIITKQGTVDHPLKTLGKTVRY